jgi:hypothetical protein
MFGKGAPMMRSSATWLAVGIVVTAAVISAVLAGVIRRINEAASVLDVPEPVPDAEPQPVA